MLNRFAIVLVAAGAATSLAATAASPQPDNVNSYRQLRTRLFAGVTVTAIFSPTQCQNAQPAQVKVTVPTVSGGFAIRDFMEVGGNTLAFANQHLTVQPSGSPVLELIQYRVMQDESATVTVRSLSPITYQPVAPAQVFQCTLGDGLRFAYAEHEHD
ncbi:VirK family protein [Burkholderia contaminans]|uniref:VirK family protein n=1 Tax=Burkholderia contaminans TaxID=488447 RepID=UPI001CF573BB|nr:VirK family protein [Burkholderia contaminans]MCA7913347.1 VirK family protein [Burkholderia contaminans]MCA8096143.1 VirK family protein [Burkholderia contaminans]UUX39821.1 VirK family protein [Burkholderia contaminans]